MKPQIPNKMSFNYKVLVLGNPEGTTKNAFVNTLTCLNGGRKKGLGEEFTYYEIDVAKINIHVHLWPCGAGEERYGDMMRRVYYNNAQSVIFLANPNNRGNLDSVYSYDSHVDRILAKKPPQKLLVLTEDPTEKGDVSKQKWQSYTKDMNQLGISAFTISSRSGFEGISTWILQAAVAFIKQTETANIKHTARIMYQGFRQNGSTLHRLPGDVNKMILGFVPNRSILNDEEIAHTNANAFFSRPNINTTNANPHSSSSSSSTTSPSLSSSTSTSSSSSSSSTTSPSLSSSTGTSSSSLSSSTTSPSLSSSTSTSSSSLSSSTTSPSLSSSCQPPIFSTDLK